MSDRGGIGRGFNKLVCHVKQLSNVSKGKDAPAPAPIAKAKLEDKKKHSPSPEKKLAPAPRHWDDESATEVSLKGSIKGYKDGKFGPESEDESLPTDRFDDSLATESDEGDSIAAEYLRQREREKTVPYEAMEQRTSEPEKTPEPKVPRLNLPGSQPQQPMPQAPRAPWARIAPTSPRGDAPTLTPRQPPQEEKTTQPQTPRWNAARPSKRKPEDDFPPLSPRVTNDPKIITPGTKKT